MTCRPDDEVLEGPPLPQPCRGSPFSAWCAGDALPPSFSAIYAMGTDWAHAMCKAVWRGNLNSEYWNIRRLSGPGIEANEVLLYLWVVLCGVLFASAHQVEQHSWCP